MTLAVWALLFGLLEAMFLLLHTLIPNKAYRYIVPAFPLLGALAEVGLESIARDFRQDLAYGGAAALAVAALWSGVQFHNLTFGDLGPYERTRPGASAYDDWGPVNRLLIAAGRQPDLCGLKVETDHLVWLGGYSHVHRSVPLYGCPLDFCVRGNSLGGVG